MSASWDEVADRQVLAEAQLEVAAAGGEQERAVDGGRPDDLPVDDAGQVLADRVAVIGGLAHHRVGVGRQQQRERAAHPGQPQRAHRLADDVRVVADLGGQRERRVGRALPDPGDAGGRVALEDGPVLGEGDLLGRVLDRLPVGVLRAALDVVHAVPADRERDPELDQRLRDARAAITPSAGASISARWPVPTLASSGPSGPIRSTTRRAATCCLNVRRASSSMSAQAASEIGASSRCRLFMTRCSSSGCRCPGNRIRPAPRRRPRPDARRADPGGRRGSQPTARRTGCR